MSDYEAWSNRLLQTDYNEYISTLKKYINFLESTDIIKEYIDNCGGYNDQIKDIFHSALNNRHIFDLGDSEMEETSFIFSMLKYMSTNFQNVPYGILLRYSSAKSFNDKISVFNHRVVNVLILNISKYLKKEGIKMGMDDNTTFVINNQSGQVNVANDNATINATQNNGIKAEDVTQLIDAMRAALAEDISDDDRETANDSMDIIQDELLSEQPNEKNVKSHFKILRKIDSGVKFASACCALLTFADKVYPFLGQLTALFPH